MQSFERPPQRGPSDGYHSLGRRSPLVGPDTQETLSLSDPAIAACQSDENIAFIASLLEHVIHERKDLGCSFRRFLVYFIIWFWFLELKGITLSKSREATYEVGNHSRGLQLTSREILAYLDQFVHPLPGFTARLQNGSYFSPGSTVVRRLKSQWEEMGTRVAALDGEEKSVWTTLGYVYGPELPPLQTSDEAKNMGAGAYKLVYMLDWHNLLKIFFSPTIPS
jgi:hypothetical protein